MMRPNIRKLHRLAYKSARPVPGNPLIQGSAMFAITCPVCLTKISLKKTVPDKEVACPACGLLTPVPGVAQTVLLGDWVLTPEADSGDHVVVHAPEVDDANPPTDPPVGTSDATVTIGSS